MARKQTDEQQLAAKLGRLLRRCSGFDGDKVENDRQNALNYYFQRLRGDEVEGASKVVSGDLSAMVEANLAQMMDAFSGDAIAEFHATDQSDEEQAALESCVVQYFVMYNNNGFYQFLTAIKDALLLRNAIVKVWVDERRNATRKKFLGVTDEALPEFFVKRPGIEIDVGEYNPEEGTLRATITEVKRRFKVEAVPLENFLYLDGWDCNDLQEIPFCAERHVEPRSNLLEYGYDKAKVAMLPVYREQNNQTSQARNPGMNQNERVAIDKSQDLVCWYECYVLLDTDNDGISERRMIALSESATVILADEPAALVPYAGGTAIVNPHRFLGISLFDKLRQSQDVSTGLQRSLLDNVTAANKPRLAYLDGLVSTDDLDNGRPNASVRVRRAAGEVGKAIQPIVVPDLSAGILQNLEYQRNLRSEMGGAALDLATGNMQLNERLGSQGLDRAYSVMEQLAALMTRTVACTLIRDTFLIAHATLRASYDEPVNLKQSGRWISAVPAQWQRREGVTVKVGMSPGERQRRVIALEKLATFQESMAKQGMEGVLVDLERYYRLAMDWCRAQDIPNPEQYFIDPQTPQSQQALKQKSASQQQEKQAQNAFLQQAVQLEQMRTAMDKYRTDVDTQFKYWAEALRAEIEEAKIAGSATVELLKTRESSKQLENEVKLNGQGTASKAGGTASGGSKARGKAASKQ
jgi:hypothetical protein